MGTLNNLEITIANRLLVSAMGHAIDWLQSSLANGGRDRNCKFYYNAGAGGSVLQVVARSVVGGAVPELKDAAANYFNSLFDKKPQQRNSDWIDSEEARIKKEREKYGKFQFEEGTVFALDDWGLKCSDALMLCIDIDNEVTISQDIIATGSILTNEKKQQYSEGQVVNKNTVKTKHIVWYDTTALVNVSSDKNLISTRVVGRDYSRKELISNGDIKFSVSGQITSGRPDIYPTEEVAKFLKVMKYKGIVKVNNQILDQFGVEYIVITDFNMPAREGNKSTQAYSFSAIGLQPAKELEITEDTITIIPEATVKEDNDSEWVKMLKGKLDGLKGLSKDLLNQGLGAASGVLDGVLNHTL